MKGRAGSEQGLECRKCALTHKFGLDSMVCTHDSTFSYIAPLRPRSFSMDAAFSSYGGLTLPFPHCAELHALAFIFTEYL